MKYKQIKDITPKELQCAAVSCPAIYEGVKEITPKEIECTITACFSAYTAEKKGKEVYLIVGKSVNPKDAGLEKKVGQGEALIEVPEGLLDGIVK